MHKICYNIFINYLGPFLQLIFARCFIKKAIFGAKKIKTHTNQSTLPANQSPGIPSHGSPSVEAILTVDMCRSNVPGSRLDHPHPRSRLDLCTHAVFPCPRANPNPLYSTPPPRANPNPLSSLPIRSRPSPLRLASASSRASPSRPSTPPLLP
jgi:hypothetical protein